MAENTRITEQISNIDQEIKTRQADIDATMKIALEKLSASFLDEKGLKEYTKYIKELAKTVEKERKSREIAARALDEATKEQRAVITGLQKQKEQLIKESNRFGLQTIKGWFKGPENETQMEKMYRARQMAGGIEQLFNGNFLSGFRQIGSTFPKIANFMGGPYWLALELTVKGLLKLDNALAKATKTATLMSGGLQSNFVGNRWASVAFNANLKSGLYDIGMQGEFENIASTMTKNYGIASYKNNQKNIIESMAYAQSGLGAYGISADQSNSLVRNLRLLEGKNETGVYAQLKRLQDRFQKMSIYSPEEALKQASSLYSQSKNLGVNFEWASRQIKNFEKSLELGTRSMSDFAAVNRSLFSGGVKQNAGIAGLVTDFAARSGISLPSSFLNQNIIGQSFSLSMPNLISNPNLIKAYSGQLNEMIQQMGGGTREEQAGMLQMILQSRGMNVTSQAALDSITSSGVDLEAGGIMGKKAFVAQQQAQQEAEDYQKLVREYYTGTASYQEQALKWFEKISNNTAGRLGRGASGEITADISSIGDIVQNFGAFFGTHLYKEVWDDLKRRTGHSTIVLVANPQTTTD